jgi:hypothetical protein
LYTRVAPLRFKGIIDVTFCCIALQWARSMAGQHSLLRLGLATVRSPFWLTADADSSDDPGEPFAHRVGAPEGEDLPYKVELWNVAKTSVEQVLAVTANASIGYAAFYAATREHSERYVTLRHKKGIVSRWNGPSH